MLIAIHSLLTNVHDSKIYIKVSRIVKFKICNTCQEITIKRYIPLYREVMRTSIYKSKQMVKWKTETIKIKIARMDIPLVKTKKGYKNAPTNKV